jgi:hypothetical protein
MLSVRKSDERGRSEHGWLDSRHTFSFAGYHDPRFAGFRSLLVINEDRVAPGGGFAPHAHSDMEIISYVLEGALEHRDSLGTGSVIRPGEIQRMSAGSGIRHSEYNHEPAAPVHFLQIWITPDRAGLPPGYEQKAIATDRRLALIGGPDGGDGAVVIHQDARLWRAAPAPGKPVEVALAPGRYAWVQATRGAATVNGVALAAGDGAAVSGETALAIAAEAGAAELLVFDLA